MAEKRKKPGPKPRSPLTKSEERNVATHVFWSLVDKNGPFPPSHTEITTRCWEWIGGFTSEGYGRFRFGDHTYYVRRFAWTIAHGEPKGLVIMDRCGNRKCVRHLAAHAPSEKLAQARQVRRYGENHPNAKLTDAKVNRMRAAYAKGATASELATRFGVSLPNVTKIVARRAWTHL